MEKLTIEALNTQIDKIIQENKKAITKNLLAGADHTMTAEEVSAIMIMNCLSLSMKLSVRVTLELLQSAGNLEIDEKQIAKLYLQHLSSFGDGKADS